MTINLGTLDAIAILKIALAFALAFGLKDLVVRIGHEIARAIRKHVKGTPSKADDAVGEVAARLVDMATDAAERGDLAQLAQVVTSAIHLPPPAAKPKARP